MMTTDPLPVTDPARQVARVHPPSIHLREAAICAALVIGAAAVGVLFGVETLAVQSAGKYYDLANSGAVWTLVAFLAGLACARHRIVAVIGGGATLLAEVVGYYAIAIPQHGFTATTHEQLFWSVAAIWIGPLAGLAAWHWRRGPRTHRLTAATALAGLFVGEGLYEHHYVHHLAFGTAEIVAGLVFGLLNVVLVRADAVGRSAALTAGGIVAFSTLVVYAHPMLL